LLAEKLGEDLRDQEGIKIARLQKMVDVWVWDLDDSISLEEVAERIAEVGACARDSVRIGVIRATRDGLGSVLVQCSRCLGIEHVKAVCPSKMDHSGCCYRCGAPGHTARSYVAEACCLSCR